MPDRQYKALESRLRRALARQGGLGYGLQRSRTDGTYLIYDANTSCVVGGPGMGLDDVARWVNS